MLQNGVVIAAAFGYIGLLFVVAFYGDRLSQSQRARAGIMIYPLSLAIYCTSWTFFGSVGNASIAASSRSPDPRPCSAETGYGSPRPRFHSP